MRLFANEVWRSEVGAAKPFKFRTMLSWTILAAAGAVM